MRKKSDRGSGCASATTFLEDFTEEFFTCAYFFKCLGDYTVEKGGEMASVATCSKREAAPDDGMDERHEEELEVE